MLNELFETNISTDPPLDLTRATWGVELECSGLYPGVEFPNQMAVVDWGESWTCLT